MSKFAEKIKFPLYVLPDTMSRVEQLHRKDGCASKSEFIEKAVNFYCGYITATDYRDYFPSIIVSTVKGSIDSFENRMASLMFKNAVELSMLLHVVSATNNVDEKTLSELRGFCVNEVKRLQGTISFDAALRYQKE